MRARFNPTGLTINMDDSDIDKSKLECIVKDFHNLKNEPKLVLEIKDYVVNTGNKESPGFHIETFPHKTGFDVCSEIYVFIDKRLHHQVFFEYDSEFDGGFFITRSPYDRIDISYWSPDKSHWGIQK
ncbi:MAG: hypothetical protein ACP5OA_01090 [Candidatus Woesearchaeota archaeon]